MLQDFLEILGLHAKEQELYLTLLREGHSTAAQIAYSLQRERTSTFKLLMSMHHNGYLTMTGSENSRLFAVVELEILEKQFNQQISKLQVLKQDFGNIQKEYQKLHNPITHRSSVQLFEGTLGLRQAQQHILDHIKAHQYISCYCIASKTFESLAQNNKEVQKFQTQFIEQLQGYQVSINGIYAHGMSLIESLVLSSHYQDALDLPTSNNTIQIRITGYLVTTFLMKKNPQIIQITSHELSTMWMFLAEQLQKSYQSL